MSEAAAAWLGGWKNIRIATEELGVDIYVVGWHKRNPPRHWQPVTLRADRPTLIDQIPDIILGPQRVPVRWHGGIEDHLHVTEPAIFPDNPGIATYRQAVVVAQMEVPIVLGLCWLGEVITLDGTLNVDWQDRPAVALHHPGIITEHSGVTLRLDRGGFKG